MMMMGSYFMKKQTPFKHVYIHPLIRDEKGQKMSKSKGNVIDPLNLIDKYGADTLRFTLTALLNPGRDVKLSESRVKGYKSFTHKIWNASNFLQINNCELDSNFNFLEVKTSINQWLINELAITSKNINRYMSSYLFHEVANEIYHFVWHTYCDWYVEFAKSLFHENSIKSEETKNTAMFVFKEILKFSHPIMPFITEKLWSKLFDDSSFLMNETFSEIDIQKKYEISQFNFKNLILIISSVRNLRSELNIPYKNKINLNINNNDQFFCSFLNEFEKEIIGLLKLDNLSINNSSYNNKGSANIVSGSSTLIIPLGNIIDTEKELNKLSIKKEKEILELDKIEGKLNNRVFIDKAPDYVVMQFKKQSIEIKSSIEKIEQIINTIN